LSGSAWREQFVDSNSQVIENRRPAHAAPHRRPRYPRRLDPV